MTKHLFFLLALIHAAPAFACPLCHTSTADLVRQGLQVTLQNESIWLAMISPFVVIGVIIGILNRQESGDKNESAD
jgi:hypothetical protein